MGTMQAQLKILMANTKHPMVTISMALVEICKTPGITAKTLSERLGDFPTHIVLRTVEKTRYYKIVSVEGEGILESITSKYPDVATTIQAALNAGLDVDRLISSR